MSEAPWQLAWCDICRDGGSYGAVLVRGEERIALWLQVLPWDHPRDLRYGSLWVSTGDRPEARGDELAPGSEEEGRWLAALRGCTTTDAYARFRASELMAELQARRPA